MGDPHNPSRYGELWPQHKIDAALEELDAVKPHVVLSGGWAWHFMSPPGHPELKHAHDHKDLDLFVEPALVGTVVDILKGRGFERDFTKYDRLPSAEDFRRYRKDIETTEHPPFKIVIDFFVRRVPERAIDGWRIADAAFLLTLYGKIHSSDKCFAVQAAAKLLARGIDPVGRSELSELPAAEAPLKE